MRTTPKPNLRNRSLTFKDRKSEIKRRGFVRDSFGNLKEQVNLFLLFDGFYRFSLVTMIQKQLA